jgi:hypothetical protein
MFFLLAFLYRFGAIVLGACPSIQLDPEKSAIFPLPIVTIVDALKRSTSALSHGNCMPSHAFSLTFHCSHNHLSLSALAKRSRSSIPRPHILWQISCGLVNQVMTPVTKFWTIPFPNKASS